LFVVLFIFAFRFFYHSLYLLPLFVRHPFSLPFLIPITFCTTFSYYYFGSRLPFIISLIPFFFVSVTSAHLATLKKDLRYTRSHALAQGTYSNLSTHFKSFFMFCHHFHLTALPVSLNTLCLYIQFLSRSLAPTSIRNYVSGVKHLHIVLGYEFPYSGHLLLKLVFRGIERLNPHVPNRAPPVSPSHLVKLASVVDWSSLHEVTVYTVALFLFMTLARLGNTLPPSHKSFSTKRFLCSSDVAMGTFGVLVTFRHTKTIQLGKRRLVVPVLRVNHSPLCLTSALQRMQSLQHSEGIHSTTHSPLFLVRHRSRTVSLSKSQFLSSIRHLFSKTDISFSSQVRGHSFKRGGASHAFKAGLPCELIQIYGDWKSDAYRLYLDISMNTKLAYASHISSALSQFHT